MKRCPDCEFIYEDEQGFCDMDGQVLVPDNALVTIPQLIPATSDIPNSLSLRGIAFPAYVGLTLAALLSVGYYVSTNQLNAKTEARSLPAAAQGFDINAPLPISTQEIPLPKSIASESISAAEAPDDPQTLPTSKTSPQSAESVFEKATRSKLGAADEGIVIPRNLPPLPRLRRLPRLSEATPLEKRSGSARISRPSSSTRQQQNAATVNEKNKKESKFGSLLKKTGRILTKPFKR